MTAQEIIDELVKAHSQQKIQKFLQGHPDFLEHEIRDILVFVYTDGMEEGDDEGRGAAYEDGCIDGREEGVREGEADGYNKGLEQGLKTERGDNMPNPVEAFRGTNCDNCDTEVEEGEDLFFYENDKLCASCAEEVNIICKCEKFKKPEFDQCYDCVQGK